MTEPLLELRQVHLSLAGRAVLRGVNFALYPQERVGLTGPNGAGKTSLLHLLMGLRRPGAGGVFIFGQERREEADFIPVRRRVGLIFQDPDDQLFCPTVIEDIAFGPLNLGRSPADARAEARKTLEMLRLEGLEERVTHHLSAGEKRLVALATVLAMHPAVLLLDEPTNGLDDSSEARLLNHLQQLEQPMVIVSHDPTLLKRLATRTVGLSAGCVTEQS